MSAAPLALLIALCAPPGAPVELDADRLEATPAGWSATGLRLRSADGLLEATAARLARGGDCLDGRLLLDGARITRGAVVGSAQAARVCLPDPAVELDGVTLRGPRLRARAAHARWADGALDADDLWISPCGCDDPPWRVAADRAEVEPGAGAWLTWPVLRAGEVPILAAPVVYVPLARRRSGLLAPRLGWDGVDGLYGALPLFWAPAGPIDLTVAPGWRAAPGLTVDGRLRWAATAAGSGEIEARSAPLAGQALVAGAGSAPIGPLRLAVDGQWADSAGTWDRYQRGFVERGRRLLRAEVGAASTAGDLGVGARVSRLALRPGIAGDDPQDATVPAAWLRIGGGLGPLRVTLDGSALQVLRPGPDGEVFDLALRAEAVQWLGPLRLRPVLAGRTRIHPSTAVEAAEQSLAGMAGLEAEVALSRRHAAGLHRIGLTLDGRRAVATAPGARVLDHADRPRDAADLGLTAWTDLVGRRWLGRVGLRLAWDALAGELGPPGLRARVDGPLVGLDVDAVARGALDAAGLWIDARLGPPDGPRAHVGWRRARLVEELPWLDPVGLILPTRQPLGEMTGESLNGLSLGATLPLGPATLSWRGALDLAPGRGQPTLVGQIGAVDWRGRCDCWAAGIQLGHEAGRPAPDVVLSLTLGAIDG